MYAAWQCSALSPAYMQRALKDLNDKMQTIEVEELAPPGWKASWDRYAPVTTNLLLSPPILLLLLLPFLLLDDHG